MPRLGRYFLPDQPQHVIQRGNDRQAVFFSDEDREAYLGWLLAAARKHGCAIHAYVLMTNHVHLLATPALGRSLPGMMQSLGRRYVRYLNDAHGRTGTLWEGRYRAAPIDSERYLLACSRYIELNPVRARMVRHPRAYRWSSYRANALGGADPLVTPHALYLGLGRSAAERRESYRALFRETLAEEFVDELRAATNGGWALGGEAFKRRIAKAAKRRAEPLPRGRPGGRPPARPKDKRQLDLL
ncbi:MAG: transposase [Dongiaceae bacterium]